MHELQRFAGRLSRARALAAAVVLASGCLVARAQSGDYLNQVNRAYAPIDASRRSDLVLLPLMAKMDAPPPEMDSLERAALLPASAPSFASVAAWAGAPAQRAVLDALARVTQETDWRRAYAFGQPYGFENVEPELIEAGLYTQLGDPPTLAAARHGYLPALDRVAILVNVEASRLVGEGKPGEAIDVLTNWAYLSRSMCDRQFFEEASWGLRSLAEALERIRDVAYVDSRGARAIKVDRLLEQLKRLSCTEYLDLSRMQFPMADRAGAEQMLARVYVPRGRVDEQNFASAMARLGASDHPLRLFSEAARWGSAAGSQADWNVATEKVKGVYDDWQNRWLFDWFDRRQSLRTSWSAVQDEISSLAVLQATTPDMGELASLRQIAKVECVGTRTALAVLGATYQRQSAPPQLSAVRPRWVTELDDDPYNPSTRDRGGKPPLEFFVPQRDTPAGEGGVKEPYAIDVVTSDPSRPLSLRLTDDVFVLYSWGSDNAKNFAKRTMNTSSVVQGADYLIWPPVVSLQRQHLMDLGQLK
ncbi:MAG: hypothetical protein SFY69_12080 [Planctomycetota bacterium]|nr:hypothetical protein [Planctomycetota bacterium]